MGNCGSTQKELSLQSYMESTIVHEYNNIVEYHPPEVKIDSSNYELNKKVL